MKDKTGIVLVYDPHNLYQFIWYYCTYGKEYEWIALCLPNGYKGEYMSRYCEKSGIFKKVICDNESFLSMRVSKKLKVFIKMLVYAIRGRQLEYCKQFIGKYISCDEYDLAVVLTDVGIVSGAFIGVSSEKETVILEDGMGDYAARPKGYLFKHLLNPYDWQGYMVAKMGYSNPAHYYPLETTRYCKKYSSNPKKMIYRKYKSMERLFDLERTDEKLFQKIIKRVYTEIAECDFERADVIIFTNRLNDFGHDVSQYVQRLQEHINNNYKSIIIKRHPRDETKYAFKTEMDIQEVDSSVPAEVLLPYIKGKKIVFMLTSSIMLYMKAYDYKPYFLYFQGLYEKNQEDKTHLKYVKKEEMQSYLERFDMEECSIIEI